MRSALRFPPALATLLLLVPGAGAAQHPVNLTLLHPAQIFPETDDIRGVRINLLYGRNANVSGLELGVVAGHATGDFSGLQWQPVNLVDGSFTGWQTGMIFSQTRGEFHGLQSSTVNLGGTYTEGVQFGLFNMTDSMNGLQLGLINVTEQMHGFQIGLLNIIQNKETLPILPLVNWTF